MANDRAAEERRGLSPRAGKVAGSGPAGKLAAVGRRFCRTPTGPGGQLRCGLALVAASGLCFLLCAYAVAMLARFSPLYTPVRCEEAGQSFADPSIGDPIVVSGNQTMSCENANPYPLVISSLVPGRVLVNESQLQIGEVIVETFSLPARGRAEMRAQLVMSFSMDVALWFLTQNPVEVLLDLHMQATASVGVILATVSMTREQVAECGFAMEATLPLKRGPTVCALTAGELRGRIPGVELSQPVVFEFSPDPKELASMQKTMNAACGVAVAVFAAAGLLLLYAGTKVLLRRKAMACDGGTCDDKASQDYAGQSASQQDDCCQA